MTDWYEIRRVNDRLWMIAEPLHVVSWLYLGTERAALIDTGMGIVPIADVVARLTDLPVIVINTHYHFDHIGGNPQFTTRLACAGSAPLLARPAARNLLDRYVGSFNAILDAAAESRRGNPDLYAMTPEAELRPWPDNFHPSAWNPGNVPPTGLLNEGDVIELGGASLTVVDTPGHSPDGISLFDPAAGILFVGDTLTEGPLYAHYDESSTANLLESVQKLQKLPAPVRMICAAHVARAIAETSLIGDTAAALAAVLAGRAVLTGSTDIFGYTIREARIGRVWVTQPSGACSYQLYD